MNPFKFHMCTSVCEAWVLYVNAFHSYLPHKWIPLETVNFAAKWYMITFTDVIYFQNAFYVLTYFHFFLSLSSFQPTNKEKASEENAKFTTEINHSDTKHSQKNGAIVRCEYNIRWKIYSIISISFNHFFHFAITVRSMCVCDSQADRIVKILLWKPTQSSQKVGGDLRWTRKRRT